MTINSTTTTDCANQVGVQVQTPTNDDRDRENHENLNLNHHENKNDEIKVKKANERCHSLSRPSVLITLTGSRTQKDPCPYQSPIPIETKTPPSPSGPQQIPPKPVQRRSKLLQTKQISDLIHNPVDTNNNTKLCVHQIDSENLNIPVKIPVSRHRSCPIPEYGHNSHNQQQSQKLKEKITRVDMVPAPDKYNKIFSSKEICDRNLDDAHDGSSSNRKKKKNGSNHINGKVLPVHQQLSDWKTKLTRELDVYQQILKQRQLLRQQSSRSAEPSKHRGKSSNKHHQQHHYYHHCNGHHHVPATSSQNKSKTMKLMTKTRDNTVETIDSLGDSLGDSWEETTASIASNGNNNNTAITTSNSTSITLDSGKTRILTRESKSAPSEKSTTSNKNNLEPQPVPKRRSASLKRNVKIVTPYEKVLQLLESDKTWQKEIAYGRRIGLYRFRGDIGNGNFSQVKIAVHTLTKEKVAVKILDKSRLDMKTQKMLSREIRTMETLHHPNLIRIFEVIESLSKHFIVMELAPGGELFQVISTNGRFSESEAPYFFSQIISAIDHMHQHNLIHRDIKAENVFFADPATVKVGDFGFSTHITSKDELLSTFCGSPPYAAPELFRDESYRGPYVDYWALGVLLYFIVTGMMPFRAQNIVSLKKLILDCRYDIPTYISVECCQLITGFLQPEPLKRYTLEQARQSRWLHNQPIQRSLQKYDLKNSYAKLIKRRTMKNIQQESSFNSIDSPKKLVRHTVYADGQYSSMEPSLPPSSPLNDRTKLDYQYPPLNDDEKETFHQLMLLGIDEQVLNDHLDKGSHSHIVGTFRILMHRVLRESIERQKYSSRNKNLDDIEMSPIRRSTSMSVTPLDRIWAYYARRAQQQNLSNKQHPNGKCQPTSRSGNNKILEENSKKNQNHKLVTKTNQSSNDNSNNGKPTPLTNGNHKQSSPLHMFSNSGRILTSPQKPPSPITKTNEEQSTKETAKKDAMAKPIVKETNTSIKLRSEPMVSMEPPTPVEEIEVKETIRIQEEASLKKPNKLVNNENGLENDGIARRLTRSFRTLKHLLTENNICGNTSVVQPQIISVGTHPTKPHVIHKTTTLQIVPLQNAIAAHWIWPQNNGKPRTKLWRSQTTPDVSLINGGRDKHLHLYHHHQQQHGQHLTLPCYHCDNSNYPLRSSNKKSFIRNNNRCTII